jgi:hypothetical protein
VGFLDFYPCVVVLQSHGIIIAVAAPESDAETSKPKGSKTPRTKRSGLVSNHASPLSFKLTSSLLPQATIIIHMHTPNGWPGLQSSR